MFVNDLNWDNRDNPAGDCKMKEKRGEKNNNSFLQLRFLEYKHPMKGGLKKI